MKNRTSLLFLLLLALAVVAGWLLSGMSLFGKFGVSVVYKEYGFLKVWWKGAALISGVWLFLFGIQSLIYRYCRRGLSALLHAFFMLLSAACLYATYQNFRSDLTHRWLGERFHLGAYLFWIGWMIISLFFLARIRTVASAQQVKGPQQL